MDSKPYLNIQPQVLSRVNNAPTFGPSIIGERTIPCEFSYSGPLTYEEAWNQLLIRLNIYDTRPGQLRCERLDGTIAYCDAVLALSSAGSFSGLNDITSLPAIFTSVDPFWKGLTPATASKSFSNALDQAFAAPIISALSDEPIITIKPTSNRTGGSSVAGSRYHRTERITNNTGAPIVNEPYALSIGNSATLVSGSKALASGNDLRVFRDGQEIARTLAGWNTATTYVWIVIPNLAAGATMDVEIVYGNSSAGTPPTHTGTTSLSIDPATSTNAVWKYPINPVAANAGLGAWDLDSGTVTPAADTGAPASWKWSTTLQSSDDLQQDRFSSFVDSGTKYRAIFAAERARGGGGLSVRDSTTRGDGVTLYTPATISQVRCDLSWLNDFEIGAAGNAVGRLVILSSVDGVTWNVAQEFTGQTALADISTANYAIPNTKYVAFAVWPRVGDTVPTTATAGRRIFAQWKSVLEVTRNASLIPQTTVQAEEGVYEYALELRIGGDTALNAPYKALRIGGAGDRRLITRVNEQLRLDTGARTAEVWDSSGASRVSVPSVLAVQAVEKINSSAAEQAAGKWLDIQPYINPLPNPSAVVNTTGWAETKHANATTTWGRDASVYKTAPGAFFQAISASTVGNNLVAGYLMATDYQPIAGRTRITVAAEQHTTNANLQPALTIWFYNAAQVLLSSSEAAAWVPATNTWYRRVHSAPVPANAAYFRVGSAIRTKSANQTGTVRFDDIQPNGLDLIVTDATGDIGAVDITVSWLTQYL